MATYARSIRRGLPRTAGGEAWPLAGEALEADGDGAAASLVVKPLTADAGRPVAASHGDGRASAKTVESTVTGGAEFDPLTSSRAGDGSATGKRRALRRGLPRVPGGTPWPPVVRLVAGESSRLAVPRDETERVGVPPATVAAGATASAGPVSSRFAQSTTGELEIADLACDGSLRRGLPRVAGAEPWPPASAVRRQRNVLAPTPSAGLEFDSSTNSGTADGVVDTLEDTRTIRRGLTRTTTAATGGPVPALTALTTSSGVSATDDAASIVPVGGERPPLPYTRTVWPGAAARTRPRPKPEPRRYGPFTKLQWAGAALVAGAGLLFAAGMVVLATRWLLSLEFMQQFLAAYPGEYPLPENAPVGIPPWLGWQHFFNTFLIVLIIRSGLQVRTEKRPSVFWSPRNNRQKISLNLWFHQSLDILWIVNGVIYVVLLFATGQWMKIVPTSWAVFPNALSAALQYVSLDWPTENGWVNYNSLQQLAYFATVFLAAPLATLTGVRMSGVWPKNAQGLNRAYPIEWARAVHFPMMIYFVLFIVAHVTLVFATGALRNLNHMYASQDAVNWAGFWIFVASLAVIAAAWIAARPLVLAPIARLFGNVTGR
ncbi:cytochrome b/b6 domain-containing protein [Microbacterium sp. F51-2R]|uniref:cytochrome b/b6 domain-containing protein n=1 Tax=Microbacterium sp. F51-2R TaxID=3445777 RepID=UPI003FA01015